MQIIKICRGVNTVIETGTRKKLTNRLKQLRSATRKGTSGHGDQKYRVRYELKEE